MAKIDENDAQSVLRGGKFLPTAQFMRESSLSLVQARVKAAMMQAAETGQCCVRIANVIMPDSMKKELEALGYVVTLENGAYNVRW